VSSEDREIKARGEKARFLWGLIRKRKDSGKRFQNPRQLRRIELVYEGEDSNRLYLVRNVSLDEIHLDPNFPTVAQDKRYKVFGFREIYKAFFSILNDKLISGALTAQEYMSIFQLINDMSKDPYCKFRGSSLWDSARVPSYFRRAKAECINYHIERLAEMQPAGIYAEQARAATIKI
jgi:hypothetical protein